ncbi:hypothetical protein N8198_05825 [Gammaproteobacteria bacterium]|nr:hypothetical protein [Gammaproteobacteria bacterium]
MNDSFEEEQKEYEARLQRRLQILKKQFDEGNIHIAEGLQVIDSIKAVGYAPDGSIDLNTVDGLVRSMALGAEYFHDREELKAISSLSDIQNTYYEFLENNFGQFYEGMIERKLTPHDVAMAMSRENSTIEEIISNLPKFLGTITEYWETIGDVAHAHVEDMHSTLKGVFGGDLFPAHDENIASKCGIYTDTIVLPDPFIRSLGLFERWGKENQAYYFIKHALNLLQYKELACANVDPPIVVVVPDYTALESDEKKFIYQLGQDDALMHAARVFGRQFESFAELMEYSGALDSLEKLIPKICDSSRVLFDTSWEGGVKDHIARAMEDQHAQLLGTKNPGIIVASQSLGRMSASNELLIKARRLRGTPIIDAPTSWQYFVWKLEYDAERKEQEEEVRNLHVLKGLQSLAENEMEWLGNVPTEALIELRKIGALEEIRDVLGHGIDDLSKAFPGNFYRTTDQVFDNIHDAFKQHRISIEELKAKKWKFAGSDIGSWFVVGSLAVTAAATGLPVWGLAAIAADQVLDAPKLKDIPQSIKNLAKESNEVNQSPVGILFKYGGNKA